MAVQVLDQALVLYRDSSGTPHALLDRCCHRGVRLSLGEVHEGALTCRYHGWRYDGEGRCVAIPSLDPALPIPIAYRVPAFPCAEQDGYVWVWMGGTAQPTAPPGIAEFGRHRWQQGTVHMQCASMMAIENNLDWTHGSFTHPWTHGHWYLTRVRGLTPQEYEMRATERGLALFTPVTAHGDDPIPERPFIRIDFELPDRVRVEYWKPARLIVVTHFVPTGTSSCRVEWQARRAIPLGARVRWQKGEPSVLKQDRLVLESAQPWYDADGGAFERNVVADASTLMARSVVRLAAQGRWPADRGALPARRVVRVRT
jgi:nitrite reductase/ring-hydroxylating ferredoxin subunit